MKKSAIAASAAVFGLGLLAAAPVKAEVLASAKAANLCLDVNQGNNQVIMWGCHGAANQNFFTSNYGQQRFNGMCLDFEGAGATQAGNILMMRGCVQGKRSQMWALNSTRDAPGQFQNEDGWCADVFQGNVIQGQKIVAWQCKWGIDLTRDNQTFMRGRFGPAAALGAPALASQRPGTYVRGGQLIGNDAGSMVAAGAGNMVAAGAGNVIAVTGGGMVAAGSLN